MPRNMRFFSSKRAASFKDEKISASTIDVSKSVDLSAQRSSSLFDLPLQQATRTHVFCSQTNQPETETSVQWEIRSSSVDSKSPEGITNPIYASTSVKKIFDNSATSMSVPTSMQNIKVSNAATKSDTQVSSFFSPTPSTGRVQTIKSEDSFQSFDILNEALKIFKSLSVDISKTFATIAKSPAMPSVIKKYSRSESASGHESTSTECDSKLPRVDGDCTNPKYVDSLLPSEHDELMEILAALQLRCLEYREMIRDYSDSIFVECSRFTESSIHRVKTFSDSIASLSDNFSNFKELCKKQLKNIESENFANIFADFMQVMYLHTLEEQNGSYLTRLQSGVSLMKAYCKFVWYEKRASLKIETLVKEIDNIRRISVGYRV